MTLRLAFIGFRHGHILDLYRRALATDAVEVVAACEPDEATRQQLAMQGEVHVTHSDPARMLADVACDAVAVGDVYGRRGETAIAALEAGKHVLSDKPICTRLSELEQIGRLAMAKGLRVGCMLELRDTAALIGLRQAVRGGRLGSVCAVLFGGQHPLLLGQRPAWYFEPGQHGGTINDIAVHALDAIPWVTDLRIVEVVAARCWSGLARAYPHFQDGAQLMLALENGAGVLGDVSYYAPGLQGYTSPLYWRITVWGSRGVAEVALADDHLTLILDGEAAPRRERLPDARPGGYLQAFLHDIADGRKEGELGTHDVLRATRSALLAQWAADSGTCHVLLGDGG
jgi:predicted dehydrogenase